MKFGVSMPNVGEAAALVDLAVTAEGSGWDGFYLWDHINWTQQMHDPWVLLGAIAARTSRIRLGTLVTPVPRRRPWKLAKEAVTLDHLSAGRAVLGVGLGVPVETEYGAFGETTSVREQAELLGEALPLLDSFLRGDRVDHDGEHFQVHAQLGPPSVQKPRLPIWAAATLGRRRPLERARGVDGIFPLTGGDGPPTPGDLAGLVAELEPPEGYDVLGVLTETAGAAELAAAGATWAIEGPADPDEPTAELRARIEAGPSRR